MATHFSDLEALADHAGFGQLTAGECKLLRGAYGGDYVCCGPTDNHKDPSNNPAHSSDWGNEREVRADLIRWLLTRPEAASRVHPTGIFLRGASITGVLNLSFVEVPVPLTFRQCHLRDAMWLIGTWIPFLDLAGSRVRAITADGATFRHSVFLVDGFAAEDGVRLANAHIGGDLACVRGTFGTQLESGTQGLRHALNAEGAQVARHVFLNNGFVSNGEVWLLGLQAGGDLNCGGGTFCNPHEERRTKTGEPLQPNVLSADRANIEGGVFLNAGFSASGEVRLLHAQIGGDLQCDGGKFRLLKLQSATVKGNLFLDQVHEPRGMTVDLRNASADTLYDSEVSWPSQGNLYLDGFVYRHISSRCTDAVKRLQWLGRQGESPPEPSLSSDHMTCDMADSRARRHPEFKGQPYRQLAKVLREMGDDRGARRVLYAMEGVRQNLGGASLRSRTWSWVLKATIGYGYYPGWAVWWIVGLAVLGTAIFHVGYRAGLMTPADKEAYTYYQKHAEPPPYYQHFNSFIYSLENSVPVLKLGQDSNWTPDPATPASPRGRWVTWPSFLRIFRWFQIVFGWIFATFFIAGATGLVRKE